MNSAAPRLKTARSWSELGKRSELCLPFVLKSERFIFYDDNAFSAYSSRRKKLLGVKSVDGACLPQHVFKKQTPTGMLSGDWTRSDLLASAVYAVGLYVDDQATKQLLAPLRGKGTAAAQADQSLLDGTLQAKEANTRISIVFSSQQF